MKDAMNIAETARLIDMSRSRFYDLIGTIFPIPKRDFKNRPYYDRNQQQMILDIRKNNTKPDGTTVLFRNTKKECESTQETQGFIYVICENEKTGPIKIGISKRPNKRINDLQIGNPRKLKMHANFSCKNPHLFEKYFHKIFSKHHLVGEWFDLDPKKATESIEKCLKLTSR